MAWTSRTYLFVTCLGLFWLPFALEAAACQSGAEWQKMVPETAQSGEAAILLPDGGVPLNRPFEVEVSICTSDGHTIEQFSLNAIMPAHQHGMNYRPVVSSSSHGTYVVDGLVFHMSGLWRINVSGQIAGDVLGYYYDLKIK